MRKDFSQKTDSTTVRSRLPMFIGCGTIFGLMCGLLMGGLENAITLAIFVTIGLMAGVLLGLLDDTRVKQER